MQKILNLRLGKITKRLRTLNVRSRFASEPWQHSKRCQDYILTMQSILH